MHMKYGASNVKTTYYSFAALAAEGHLPLLPAPAVPSPLQTRHRRRRRLRRLLEPAGVALLGRGQRH
jgi:hypothetical protein